MNILQIILLTAGVLVGGTGIAALIRAVALLKLLKSQR